MPNRRSSRRMTRRSPTPRRAVARGLVPPPGYALIPLEDLHRLTAAQMAREVLDRGQRPDSDYVDADEFFARETARGIAKVRRARGLTQAALGKLVGLPQSQVSRLERNP